MRFINNTHTSLKLGEKGRFARGEVQNNKP